MKVLFISRKPSDQQSIERVFQQVARDLETSGVQVETQTLPFGSGPLGVLLNLIFFRPQPADIYHVTGHVHFATLVLPKDRTVLTIHDLGFLRRRGGIRGWFIRKLFLDLPCRMTRWVTVISDATRMHLEEEVATPPKNLMVIENPVRDEFVSGKKCSGSPNGKTVLQVGTAPHKNLETLIDAVRGTDMEIHVVGELSPRQKNHLAEARVTYRNSPVLDSDGILQAYLNSDVLSFCSTFEGFGLPIIEANAVGLPVVTSDLSPLTEVSGEGALKIDPSDAFALRASLEAFLKEPILKNAMVERGFRNSERFLGSRIAALYHDLYARVIEENH